MTRHSDPLGLTPEQRTQSNLYAAAARLGEVWWPPEVDDRVIDGEWYETACPHCRGVDRHAPECLTLVAQVLHDNGLQLEAVPR